MMNILEVVGIVIKSKEKGKCLYDFPDLPFNKVATDLMDYGG